MPRRRSREAGHALGQVGQGERVELGHGASVRGHAGRPAAELDHQLALVPGGERLEPELGDQLVHAVLGGADPLAAELHGGAVGGGAALGAPAHAVAGLQDHHVVAHRDQASGRGQAGQAGPDHQHGVGRSSVGRLVEVAPLTADPTGAPVGQVGRRRGRRTSAARGPGRRRRPRRWAVGRRARPPPCGPVRRRSGARIPGGPAGRAGAGPRGATRWWRDRAGWWPRDPGPRARRSRRA